MFRISLDVSVIGIAVAVGKLCFGLVVKISAREERLDDAEESQLHCGQTVSRMLRNAAPR